MSLCHPHLPCKHRSIDDSPVKPYRAPQYTVDRGPSLETSRPNLASISTPASLQHSIRSKRAPEGLHLPRPIFTKPLEAAASIKERRESSMHSLLRKAHALLMRRSSVASFTSVFVQAGECSSRSRPASELHRKPDVSDLRGVYRQSSSGTVIVRRQPVVRDDDDESGWMTDDEGEDDVSATA